MTLYRMLPVDLEAVQFRGGNFHEVWKMAGAHYPSDTSQVPIRSFAVAGSYGVWNDSTVLAELWDMKAQKWVPIYDGTWIIRNVDNHLLAMDEASFNSSFVKVEEIPEFEEPPFEQELQSLINRYSAENVSGTPDFILAEFMLNVLKEFNATVVKRADWRGESTELPGLINFAGVETPNTLRD